MQVRRPVVPGQVGLARLNLEQFGQCVSEALRHLGYHASEAGDAGQARQMWERSAEQRQRAGAVPYVLSQQLLLAGLARDTGDPDAARTVAREVGRWAHALGVTLLESQAAEIAGS